MLGILLSPSFFDLQKHEFREFVLNYFTMIDLLKPNKKIFDNIQWQVREINNNSIITHACLSFIKNNNKESVFLLFNTNYPEIFEKFLNEINDITPCIIIDKIIDDKPNTYLINYTLLHDYIKDLILLSFLREVSTNISSSGSIKKWVQNIVNNFSKVPKIYKGIYYLTYLGSISMENYDYTNCFQHSNYCQMKPITKKAFLTTNITNQQFLTQSL